MDLSPLRRPPLFGRADEVGSVGDLLAGGVRLITVIGPGGVGKTRVALAAAPADAALISLAGTADDGLVATMLRALAPAAESTRDPLEAIAAAANDRVVLLDTFEHLLGQAAVIGELIKLAPRSQFVVTSRSRLRLDAEQVVEVSRLAQDAAVEMLQDRLSLIGAGTCTTEEAVELCELLDGLPLSIELAAARVALLAPHQLLARLRTHESGQLLAMLGRGAMDVPERHRSIRATIAWSYGLLDVQAATLFRRLGVFPAAFGLDAVEQICGATPLTSGDVLDAMAALVDLHLVEPVLTSSNNPRFRLLDALREFALEQLEVEGERATFTERTVDWVVEFAAQAKVGLEGHDERAWLDAVDEDAPTIRVALTQLSRDGDVRRGLAVAGGIASAWVNLGPIRQGRDWFDTFLSLDTSALAEGELAVAQAWRARLAVEAGDLSVVEDIEAARDRIADPDEWLRATEHLAYARTMQGNLDAADALTTEAIARSEAEQQPAWLSVFLVRQAMDAQRRGWSEQAAAQARRAADAADVAGRGRLSARARQILAVQEPDPRVALQRLLEVRAAYEASGDRRGVVAALAALGAFSDPPEAARWLRQAIDMAAAVGYRHGEFFSVCALVVKAIASGRVRDAAELDGGLAPFLPFVKANITPALFADYLDAVAGARRALGPQTYDALLASAPSGWPALRERARAVADDMAGDASEAPRGAEPRRRGRPRQLSLSAREVEVLAAIARGGTNQQISSELSISAKTVMHHSASVYRKLGVRGRAEAIAHAYRSGLLTPAKPDG
ncbi:MAG: LuxR C-terminal-related transcriptional regulator [Actinomycetota bacterium]|nr:LuxR C-terminal-related transcriptional regulator [Actinomycetota bacterium]